MEYDVIGIGNAIVDVLARADDAFLIAHALEKGAMTLVEEARSAELYRAMPPGIEMSGGSAANTMAGIASLGGRGAYIGKVRDDQLGDVFRHDIRAAGVDFVTAPLAAGAATARSLIFVTPDAQRTMQTYLGASVELAPHDVPEPLIAAGQITYLEGYLWDRPLAKAAFLRAAELAHAAGRKVALTLSDPFCVQRHRASFLDLVADHVDVLFANEAEITSLYETEDFDRALTRARDCCETLALTRSERGSVVVAGGATRAVAAAPVERVVDTTGAGDLYAAGFLYGLTHGRDLVACGRLGGLCAAEVISHVGARPQAPLAELAAAAGA
ncbi:MAG: adenosine kinase [Dehalococcoidia bacterium]|nr:adenosine kinase [Dehalococcoidia bacterium]